MMRPRTLYLQGILQKSNNMEFLDKIKYLDLEKIKYCLTDKEEGPKWGRNRANEIEGFYKLFLYIISIYPEKDIVPSKDIDIFWHHHILDTKKYAYDCQEIFGNMLHHNPYFGQGSQEESQLLNDSYIETLELMFKHIDDFDSTKEIDKNANASVCSNPANASVCGNPANCKGRSSRVARV